MTGSKGRVEGCWERIEDEEGRAEGERDFYRR